MRMDAGRKRVAAYKALETPEVPGKPGTPGRACAGYTLVEALATVVVLSLMAVMVTTGIVTGMRSHERMQFISQYETLSATINSSLENAFRFMYKDGDSYVVTHDGRKVTFSGSASPLAVVDGKLYLVDSSKGNFALVNDGIYGSCEVSSVNKLKCTMDEVNFTYDIVSGSSMKKTITFTATPLDGVMRNRGVASGSGESPGEDEDPDAADKEALNSAIEQVEGLGLNASEPSVKVTLQEALKSALAAAQAVADDEHATQDAVDQAATELVAAHRAYLNTNPDTKLDLQEVDQAVEAADKERPWKETSDKKEELIEELQKAYDRAVNAHSGKGVTTQEEADDVADKLQEALKAYVDSLDSSEP